MGGELLGMIPTRKRGLLVLGGMMTMTLAVCLCPTAEYGHTVCLFGQKYQLLKSGIGRGQTSRWDRMA